MTGTRDLRELARLLRGLASRLSYYAEAHDEPHAQALCNKLVPITEQLTRIVHAEITSGRFQNDDDG